MSRHIADFELMPAEMIRVPKKIEKVYVPPTKHKLLECIMRMRPDYKEPQLRGYNKRRLYAIYFTLVKHAHQSRREHC